MVDGRTPEIEFQFLLAHTFPGMLLAITFFMMLDILSPLDLTSQIKNIEGFISFFVFVLLSGTILGIVLDTIHHSVIESIIFDNIKGAANLDRTLKGLCARESKPSFLKSHYFIPFIETQGLETFTYLTNLLYRYSEFYTNIFLSLIFFSFIAPFYLFYAFQISWENATSLGLAFFAVSCLCLNGGYDSYKRFLSSLIAVICGSKDHSNPDLCKDEIIEGEIAAAKSVSKLDILIYIAIFSSIFWIPRLFPRLLGIKINIYNSYDVLIFFIVGIIVLAFFSKSFVSLCIGAPDESKPIVGKSYKNILNHAKERINFANIKLRLCKVAFGILISTLFGLFFILLFLKLYYMPCLLLSNPQSINFDPSFINQSSESSLVVSLQNLGADAINVSISTIGINERYARISYNNTTRNVFQELFLGDLTNGNHKFFMIHINKSKNHLEYKGEIKIKAETQFEKIVQFIPLDIKL